MKKKKNCFLFVGRLSKNKRIDLLIDAFSLLQKKGIDFELRIVGEDWEGILPELKQKAKEEGVDAINFA